MQTIVRKIKGAPKSNIGRNIISFIIDNKFILLVAILLYLKALVFISFMVNPSGAYPYISYIPIGAMNIFVYAGFTFIVLSPAFLFKARGQKLYLIIINLVISLFLFSDLIYFRGFKTLLSPYCLSQGNNLNNLGSTIISLIRFWDMLFFIDFIPLIILCIKIKEKNSRRKPLCFVLVFVLSLCPIMYKHLRYDFIDNGGYEDKLFYITCSPSYNVAKMTPLGYHMYDIYLYFENSKRLELTEDESKEISQWYDKKQEKLPENNYLGMLKGKNLLVIQVESLENMVINQRLQGAEITPNINKLVNNGIYFSNIHEQVNGGNSSDSDLMMNASVYPVKNGSTFFRFPDNTYNSMAKLLKDKGYYTSAFHPDAGGYWNWMPALSAMGFDKCTDITEFKVEENIGLGISDGSYLSQLSDKIAAQPKPFYSFFVTLTSHSPFEIPDKYKELQEPKELQGSKLMDYLHSVHYTDKELGKFFAALEEKGILKDTVIVLYGDHAGINKYYKDKLQQLSNETKWWNTAYLQIPFIISYPGMKAEEKKVIGGPVDYLPTVSYIMGIEPKDYSRTAIGRNLLNTKRSFVVLSGGVFLGENMTAEEEAWALKGYELSDLMLRSNYFKK